MAFPWLKIVSAGFTAIREITEAAKDGKVTVEEALAIVANVCKSIGAAFDSAGAAFATRALEQLFKSASDRRITVAELIAIGEGICADLGVELDKTGVTIPA